MTPEELQTSYDNLTRLANELSAHANSEDRDGLQRVVAGLGSVLALVGKMVADSKTKIDEVTRSTRRRDRRTESLRDEEAIRYFAQLKVEDRERVVQAVE